MPSDVHTSALQAQVTKTANFHGAAIPITEGTPRSGDAVSIIYSAASDPSLTNEVTFTIDVSSDGSTGWNTIVEFKPIVLTATAQAAEIFRKFETLESFFRISAVFAADITPSSSASSGTAAAPTITYSARMLCDYP